jgi:hypothetical protein
MRLLLEWYGKRQAKKIGKFLSHLFENGKRRGLSSISNLELRMRPLKWIGNAVGQLGWPMKPIVKLDQVAHHPTKEIARSFFDACRNGAEHNLVIAVPEILPLLPGRTQQARYPQEI